MGYCYIYRSNLDTSALVVETVWVAGCVHIFTYTLNYIHIYIYTYIYIYIYIHIYIYKQISNTPWAEARPIIYGRWLMVADGRRMPMDVVELAMHEVAMRGVAMLHDCLYTLRYTPPVYIRFAISTSPRLKYAW